MEPVDLYNHLPLHPVRICENVAAGFDKRSVKNRQLLDQPPVAQSSARAPEPSENRSYPKIALKSAIFTPIRPRSSSGPRSARQANFHKIRVIQSHLSVICVLYRREAAPIRANRK